MSPPIPFPDLEQTKSKILTESVRLFALLGYSAVSIRDIATAAEVHPTTVYSHFSSKLRIMEQIMEKLKVLLYDYYGMLDRLSDEADSFPQIISNMFMESKEVASPFAFYAIYCAMTNQFLLECCRDVCYDVYFMDGHMAMRRQLETAIRRGLVEPFDVPEVASTITNCFVTMISFNVGRINGYYQDFDTAEWYEREVNHILRITGFLKE